MTTPAIRATGLHKTFRATDGTQVVAVDQVDLTVERGEIVAFLGPNGAGKTTTIRMLLGLVRPTAGEIDLLIEGKLATGWTLVRLDKPMKAILRAGTYELMARADVPVGAVITEYVDVAHAFYDRRESGFVNGLLDAIAKDARAT